MQWEMIKGKAFGCAVYDFRASQGSLIQITRCTASIDSRKGLATLREYVESLTVLNRPLPHVASSAETQARRRT